MKKAAIKEGGRAHLFLTMCDEHTEWEGDERPGRKLTRWWYVRDGDFSNILGNGVSISGGGDAASLRSLERKGLIRLVKSGIGAQYEYAITEDGILELSRLDIETLKDAFMRCQYRDEDDDATCGAPPSALLHDVTEQYPISADNHPFTR